MVVPLAMGWRHVLFENWPLDPDRLETHIPDQLTLDLFDGAAWLSVVPFTNVAIRPQGVPSWLGTDLPELNVRTYVTHDEVDGVYFLSLDANGIGSVLGARLLHHLPYYYARISLTETDGGIEFRSRRRHPGARPAEYRLRYEPTGEAFAAPNDPFGEFLVERYRLYTEDQAGRLRYTAVAHEPWTLYPAEAEVHTNTLFSAHGLSKPDGAPEYYYSPGLDVVASASKGG